MKNSLIFNPVPVTAEAMVQAARRHVDCRYCDDFNFITEVDGRKVGKCNCYGVLLSTARDLGLVDADFDLNMTPSVFGLEKPKVLWTLIHNNFLEIRKEDARGRALIAPADVMMFRWTDQDHRVQATHHVAMHVGYAPHEPYGLMLHALDAAAGGGDRIFVQRISALDWQRVDSIWRLKGLAKGLVA